jgi:hypothetical protein
MMTSVQYVLGGTLISGVSNGSIFKWSGTSCDKPIKGHAGAVYAIENGKNNTFWTGANDGKLI